MRDPDRPRRNYKARLVATGHATPDPFAAAPTARQTANLIASADVTSAYLQAPVSAGSASSSDRDALVTLGAANWVTRGNRPDLVAAPRRTPYAAPRGIYAPDPAPNPHRLSLAVQNRARRRWRVLVLNPIQRLVKLQHVEAALREYLSRFSPQRYLELAGELLPQPTAPVLSPQRIAQALNGLREPEAEEEIDEEESDEEEEEVESEECNLGRCSAATYAAYCALTWVIRGGFRVIWVLLRASLSTPALRRELAGAAGALSQLAFFRALRAFPIFGATTTAGTLAFLIQNLPLDRIFEAFSTLLER